jgi:hypothetical protein
VPGGPHPASVGWAAPRGRLGRPHPGPAGWAAPGAGWVGRTRGRPGHKTRKTVRARERRGVFCALNELNSQNPSRGATVLDAVTVGARSPFAAYVPVARPRVAPLRAARPSVAPLRVAPLRAARPSVAQGTRAAQRRAAQSTAMAAAQAVGSGVCTETIRQGSDSSPERDSVQRSVKPTSRVALPISTRVVSRSSM